MANEEAVGFVRKKLNEEKIKLWLSPYTVVGKDVGCYPEDMIERFSKELNITPAIISQCLEQLRYHALDKLASRLKFESTGMAILKLKVLGRFQERYPNSLSLEISLNISGSDLCQRVAKEVDVSSDCIKLIAQGKVISNKSTLKDQNIRNNSSIMVIVRKEQDTIEEKHFREVNQTKRDAELLTDLNTVCSSQNYNLQIADQNGQVLDLPDTDRKSLAIAMTLHEKSRKSMKQKEYEAALPILLEADNEFRQCTAQILDLVDNYALLNLDIVWCYLCLRSINFLPDAERRLNICQTCFDKSYGANLERLQALKGDKTKERALFTRLHLLQGIVAYHQGNWQRVRALLSEVQVELNFLRVDDEKLSQVMALGYSSTEARLALRTSGGSVEGAIDCIITRRQEKSLVKKRNEEERKRKGEQQKLGKTLNGEWINSEFHRSLITMGYSSSEAKQALKHSNNSISLAVQILQEQRYLLNDVDEAAIAKIVSLGFDPSSARRALDKCGDNVENALGLLFSGNGALGISEDNPTTSSETNKESTKLIEDAKDAAKRLAEEIPEDEEDHLDLNMSEEEAFLAEYLSLLESIHPSNNT